MFKWLKKFSWKTQVKQASDIVSKAILEHQDVLLNIIKHLQEKYGSNNGTGSIKRSAAIQQFIDFLNRRFDIPYVDEEVEGVMIGTAVDAIIITLKHSFGQAWLLKIEVKNV